MKIKLKDLSFDWIVREWDESVETINGIFRKTPHNILRIKEPLHIRMKMAKVSENNIDIHGSFEGALFFECDRCCEGSDMLLKDKFHYLLMPEQHQQAEDGQGFSDENDDVEETSELSFYKGDEIELSGLAIEQFMLSIPYKLLCNENCKGICAGCGINLNQGSCKCGGNSRKKISKNPFSGLK